MMGKRKSVHAAAAVMIGCSSGAVAQPASIPKPVSMTANPARVCAVGEGAQYLNFDLLIDNPGAEERRIEELRALVFDRQGRLIERRLLWQQALALLGKDTVISPKSRAIIFNPFTFSSKLPGTTVRYELLFAGQPAPLAVTVHPVSCVNRGRLVLPIAGRVLVYDGFDALSHHRRGTYLDSGSKALGVTDNFQRYGLDLVVVDQEGRFFTGDGARAEQWLGWGKPVRAAGDGLVAAVHDGQPDNVAMGTLDRWKDRTSADNPMSSYGNYVLINHGGGEFSLVGHLRDGSVAVKKGDRVRAGQTLGGIGNSGASGGVHVHFERRSGWGLAGIETLPAYFSEVRLLGGRGRSPNAPAALDSGDVVIAR
jgi:hypothetical protein